MAMRSEPGFGDDDRLPWLETVEEDYSEGGGFWRVLLLVLLLLLVAGAGAFGYYWFQRQRAFTGTGELINAQQGDYKVKPQDAGGLNVEGAGDAVYSTSEGDVVNGSIDDSRAPEEPVQGKVAPAQSATPAAEGSKVTTPVPASGGQLKLSAPGKPQPAPPKPTPAPAGNATIQLGSFPDQGGADAAWTRVSKRFDYVAPLGHSVEKADVKGKTVYRLRVTAGTPAIAKDVCGKLSAAGESCFVAN